MVKSGIGNIVISLVVCVILAFPFASVCAAGCEFSLSDAQVAKGRLFSITLDCEADKELCAFIAEIEYDDSMLDYRSAKPSADNAQCSVNSSDSGRLRLVYLCEEGAHCTGKTPLVELEFKALQEGENMLILNVEQAIDSTTAALATAVGEGALVQVGASSVKNNEGNSNKSNVAKTEKSDNKQSISEKETTSTDHGKTDLVTHTEIEPAGLDITLIVSLSAAVLVLLGVVGFSAYRLGVRRSSKEQIPLDKSTDDKK